MQICGARLRRPLWPLPMRSPKASTRITSTPTTALFGSGPGGRRGRRRTVSCSPDRVSPRMKRPQQWSPSRRSSQGAIDDAKGRVKEAAGDVTGNDRLKAEGKVDRGKGKVKDAVDKAADKVTGR